MPDIRHKQLLLFAVTVLIVLGIGTPVYIYYYPLLIYNALDKAVINNGFGDNPSGVPVNTLYTLPTFSFPIYTQQSGRRKPRHALYIGCA